MSAVNQLPTDGVIVQQPQSFQNHPNTPQVNPVVMQVQQVVIQAPPAKVIPTSGREYPNQWSTGLCYCCGENNKG